MNPREAIEAVELAEAETAHRHQLAREMYQAGQRAGLEAGYRQANADLAAQWARIARPVVHGIPHAELEQRRWGPGGRAHFADQRPGDFPSRAAKPQLGHHAEQDMEAAHDRHPDDYVGRPGDVRAAGRRGERASVNITAGATK